MSRAGLSFGAGLAAVLLALSGCQSYTIVQHNVFSDDDGNLLEVEYGESDRNHVNTFISPATGKEMEFRSKLMVLVRLPDGERIKAWQCMNFLPRGTMYKTDDEQWMVLANGFSCLVYEQTREDATRYLEVYRGILCDTMQMENTGESKWKKIRAPQTGRYSKRQEKNGSDDESVR